MTKHYMTPAPIPRVQAVPVSTVQYSRVYFKVPITLPHLKMPGNGEYKEYIGPQRQADGSALIEHMGKKYEIPSGNIASWELA